MQHWEVFNTIHCNTTKIILGVNSIYDPKKLPMKQPQLCHMCKLPIRLHPPTQHNKETGDLVGDLTWHFVELFVESMGWAHEDAYYTEQTTRR